MKRNRIAAFLPILAIFLIAAASGGAPTSLGPMPKSQGSTQAATAAPPKSSHLVMDVSSTPEITAGCGHQPKIIGSDTAGVVTIGSIGEGSWNLGCQITFAEKFKTPVCMVGMSGGNIDTDVRIIQAKPESLHFAAYPNNFQGGETVMYFCMEATP